MNISQYFSATAEGRIGQAGGGKVAGAQRNGVSAYVGFRSSLHARYGPSCLVRVAMASRIYPK